MRNYRLTIVFAISAIVFTAIAIMTVDRVVIAVLFLVLLAFIAAADVSIQRSRRRELALIEGQLAERRKAEAELSQRAVALEAANRELEAFSYSVSHDLRSPLRSIDGFSQALLEDYGNRLDDAGKDYLRRVRAASQRMAQLIDDLLQLSRLTRKEMIVAEVDLSGMARGIAANLRTADPQRAVEFCIADGLVVKGDGQLLEVMLENLLGNAWKFTGKQAHARIEFARTRSEGQEAYQETFYVRDNGAGFDMDYADKLFGAFQRLHAAAEFEGTGIGLANVQRIITRHGGQVWAEGQVGQGATFYFTLQSNRQSAHQPHREQPRHAESESIGNESEPGGTGNE